MKPNAKPNTPTSAQWLVAMRRARTELGMTQAQFAGAIGMSKDAVTSWESIYVCPSGDADEGQLEFTCLDCLKGETVRVN